MTISRFDAQARLGDDAICGQCWIDRDEPFGCACEGLLVGQAAGPETLRNGRNQDEGGRGAGDSAADMARGGSGVIILPWPPKELSPNARVHWAKKSKAAKQYRAECFLLTKKAGIAAPLADEILFALEFVPPDRRKRDDDNLLASCKALRDGVADALGIDDNRFITQLRISRATVKGGEVRVRIQGESA
ncbi:RusA family crossover junction endodeoxyribonuclease [Stutzerimonas nitrititolerans]|uniref:RusA family crossover junction endodeoxyribonuclease n=1 Tax=Stutzerimonas nitrititolerans TaxID=2482751 RepID=UPI0028A5FF16|nr:hypothetical protein [Stutzerimonas nitrititolerans]